MGVDPLQRLAESRCLARNSPRCFISSSLLPNAPTEYLPSCDIFFHGLNDRVLKVSPESGALFDACRVVPPPNLPESKIPPDLLPQASSHGSPQLVFNVARVPAISFFPATIWSMNGVKLDFCNDTAITSEPSLCQPERKHPVGAGASKLRF